MWFLQQSSLSNWGGGRATYSPTANKQGDHAQVNRLHRLRATGVEGTAAALGMMSRVEEQFAGASPPVPDDVNMAF